MGNDRVSRRHFLQNAAGAAGAAWMGSAVSSGLGEPAPQKRRAGNYGNGANSAAWFVRNDSTWIDKLSPATYEIQFTFDLKQVRMRDGTMLSASIWRPTAQGKFPVIYVHTTYDKSAFFSVDRAKFFVPRGYAVVSIDARGRYDSDGVHYLFRYANGAKGFEGEDVYDCAEWIAQQPWCSGKVGMSGPSVLGYYQWLGASLNPPHLITIIPSVSLGDWHEHMYDGGVLHLGTALHQLAVLGSSRTDNDNLENSFYNWDQKGPLYRHLPLRTADRYMIGKEEPLWQDYLDHPDNGFYWEVGVGHNPGPTQIGPGKYSQVHVPALNITGWYDTCHQGVITNYLGMMTYGPEGVRDKQHLIVGPWEHSIGDRIVGDFDFGPEANGEALPQDLRFSSYFLKGVELRWMDYWLKGIDNGIMDENPVHVFTMGSNRWRSDKQWPIRGSVETRYYLSSGGKANTRGGDGVIDTVLPADAQPDRFVFDPEDPVLTYGGALSSWEGHGHNSDGPRDQRRIQTRNDVLVYTGEPMRAALEVTGNIVCKLFAASTAADTDFTAKILDVHPDGYAQILKDGVIRARYRKSYETWELIVPGKVYEYTIDLWPLSHSFEPGHRMQVEISSSNFPLYDRNPNTGHKFGDDTRGEKAVQTIYHSGQFSSHVLLPVVTPKSR